MLTICQPFYRCDSAAIDGAALDLARAHWRSVEQNRASATLAFSASVLCSGEVQLVTQYKQQRAFRIGLHLSLASID